MSAQLLPNVYQQFFGITGSFNGLPLAGGLLYSYAAGTSTPLVTYTDETAGTPNANPIVLNSVGAANVWLGTGAYKFILKDANSVVQWTIDNVSYINPGSVDLTKIDSSIAGLALKQNGSGALDVQVDQVTLQVNTSGMNNYLQVKPGGLTPSAINPASLLEVLVKNVRDYSCPGSIQQIPQYEWTSPTLLSSPTTIPGGQANAAAWCPNGEFLAVACNTTPYIFIYQRTGPIFIKLPNPTTLPTATIVSITWSPCGDFLALGTSGPVMLIYQRFGSVFVKVADPSGLPGGTALAVSFSPNSDYLALSNLGFPLPNPNFSLYKRSASDTTPVSVTSYSANAFVATPFTGLGGSGANVNSSAAGGIGLSADLTGIIGTGTVPNFNGSKFVDITSTSTMTGIGNIFSWSPDSLYFAAQDNSTGKVDVFQRVGDVFSGITPPNLSGYAGSINGFSFSPNGKFFVVLGTTTPFILIFQVQSGTFTQLSNPTSLPTGSALSIAWSANSEYMAVGHNTTPFMTIYSVSGTTFTKLANPATLPAGPVLSLDWSQSKQFLAAASGTTPFIQLYETASVLPSNAILWIREAPNV